VLDASGSTLLGYLIKATIQEDCHGFVEDKGKRQLVFFGREAVLKDIDKGNSYSLMDARGGFLHVGVDALTDTDNCLHEIWGLV